jgi:hypothetical protein
MALKGSQFAAAASNAGIGGSIHSTTVGIYSQPFNAAKGSVGENEALLETKDQTPIAQDSDYGDIAIGNPYPASFTPYVAAKYEVNVPFTATGASTSVEVPAELYLNTTQMPTKDAPLSPQITPVQNLRLNSAAFVQRLATKTLNPTLSWDPPTSGSPTGYRVSIYALTVSGTSSSSVQPVLDLFTNDHSLVIPDGILSAGNEYFFQVRAFLTPSLDFTTAPYHGAFPWSHADSLSPVLSTAGATAGAKSTPEAFQHILRRPANAPVAGNPIRLTTPRVRGGTISR